MLELLHEYKHVEWFLWFDYWLFYLYTYLYLVRIRCFLFVIAVRYVHCLTITVFNMIWQSNGSPRKYVWCHISYADESILSNLSMLLNDHSSHDTILFIVETGACWETIMRMQIGLVTERGKAQIQLRFSFRLMCSELRRTLVSVWSQLPPESRPSRSSRSPQLLTSVDEGNGVRWQSIVTKAFPQLSDESGLRWRHCARRVSKLYEPCSWLVFWVASITLSLADLSVSAIMTVPCRPHHKDRIATALSLT